MGIVSVVVNDTLKVRIKPESTVTGSSEALGALPVAPPGVGHGECIALYKEHWTLHVGQGYVFKRYSCELSYKRYMVYLLSLVNNVNATSFTSHKVNK